MADGASLVWSVEMTRCPVSAAWTALNVCEGMANFADHDDIGVLAQNGAQGVGEVEPDFGLYLDLIEVFVDHFDGVFDRRDVDFGRR